MGARGGVSTDVSYVLLESPLVPRLDLSDCRPTELPVLPETTPTLTSDHARMGSGGKGSGRGGSGQRMAGGGGGGTGGGRGGGRGVGDGQSASDRGDRVPVLPRAPVPIANNKKQQPPVPAVTDVRTLVVDMRDLGKLTSSSVRTSEDVDASDIGEEIVLDHQHPASAAVKRSGGVLKGGGDYVSSVSATGEPRPRPRVSFLLDALPAHGQEGGAVQVRVFAKPPQNSGGVDMESMGQQYLAQQQRYGSAGQGEVNEQSNKRFRPHASAESRHTAAIYKQQIRQMQAEARLREACTAASRAVEGGFRVRRTFYDDPSYNAAAAYPAYPGGGGDTSTPLLPNVAGGGAQRGGRRVPLFSFKRNSAADVAQVGGSASALQQQQQMKEGGGGGGSNSGRGTKKSFSLSSGGGGSARGSSKSQQVRFQDDEGERMITMNGDVVVVAPNGGGEYVSLHSKHVGGGNSGATHGGGGGGGGGGADHQQHRVLAPYSAEPHNPQRALGTYSASEHPPRAASCKPPLPARPHGHGHNHNHGHHNHNHNNHGLQYPAAHDGHGGGGGGGGGGMLGQHHHHQHQQQQQQQQPHRVTSASTRSSGSRVREWLSVDTVPGPYRQHHGPNTNKPRPSTVSSASSSIRSRDINSAKGRLAGSSRVSSASVKAASDPGPDLENMDLVTLNLMARRAKGPSRYRYLAKLRSLNLNTPRPLV